jgi:hypothetical protein
MQIRRYLPEDAPALWHVYHSAIRLIAVKDYTREQIEAWAPDSVEHRYPTVRGVVVPNAFMCKSLGEAGEA